MNLGPPDAYAIVSIISANTFGFDVFWGLTVCCLAFPFSMVGTFVFIFLPIIFGAVIGIFALFCLYARFFSFLSLTFEGRTDRTKKGGTVRFTR